MACRIDALKKLQGVHSVSIWETLQRFFYKLVLTTESDQKKVAFRNLLL